MAAKSPAFQLYPRDFIASRDVQTMSAAEVGGYCLLLFNAWLEDRPGYLPNNERLLRSLARLSPEQWAESKEVLLGKFPVSPDGAYRYNPRLVIEAEKQEQRRERLAENGRKGGRPKADEKPEANLDETNTEPTDNLGLSDGKQLLQKQNLEQRLASSSSFATAVSDSVAADTATQSKPKKDKGEPSGFAEFYALYQRKEARPKAASAFAKLSPEDQAAATSKVAAWFKQKFDGKPTKDRDGRDVRPMPATWLNDRRWEDVIDEPVEEVVPKPKLFVPPVQEPYVPGRMEALFLTDEYPPYKSPQ